MERHPDSDQGRVDVRHMCPKCGGGGLCDVCLGLGTLSDDQLSRYLWIQSQEG